MENHISENEQTQSQKNTFLWYQDDSSKIFPVDYSEREFAAKMHCGTRKIRARILDHSPMRDLLQGLIMTQDGQRYVPLSRKSKENICETSHAKETFAPSRKGKKKLPYPLETIPFLECYLKLESEEYKNVFEYGTDDREKKITSFMQAFCKSLCEAVLPQKQSGEVLSDATATETDFIRHTLFKNETFNKVILDDLWKDQLQQRVDNIQTRARHLQSDQRAALLKNLLISLDRYALGLPMADEDIEPVYTEEDLKEMFQSLLAGRVKVNSGRNDLAAYKIQNSTLKKGVADSETTMSEAFDDLSQCWRRRTDIDLNRVRTQFLKNLGASAETSVFEGEFLELRRYLTELPQTDEEVKERFIRAMKEWGQAKIDYCMATNFESLQSHTDQSSHVDSLIGACAIDNINWFFPTIELTRTLFVMKYTNQYDRMVMSGILREKIKVLKENDLSVNKDLAQIVPIISKILDNVAAEFEHENHSISAAQIKNLSYNYAASFSAYFQEAWNFLFHDDIALPGANGAIDINKVKNSARTFSERARAAANFFDRPEAFPYSDDAVKNMLENYKAMYTDSSDTISLDALLKFSPDILMGLLLQTFHKIACDCNEQAMRATLLSLYALPHKKD